MAKKRSLSVLKRIRQNEKRRLRNKSYKSMIKTLTKKFLNETDPNKKKELLDRLYSVLDRAVAKGIIHRNTAARRKSKVAQVFKEFMSAQNAA